MARFLIHRHEVEGQGSLLRHNFIRMLVPFLGLCPCDLKTTALMPSFSYCFSILVKGDTCSDSMRWWRRNSKISHGQGKEIKGSGSTRIFPGVDQTDRITCLFSPLLDRIVLNVNHKYLYSQSLLALVPVEER